MLSFVVPAYNEARYIAAALDSIHAAARAVGEPYEIVVANDASTDDTPRIAREHGARVVESGKRQIAGTRNAGARASTGEVLFFVDADTHVHAALIREALAALRGGAAGGGARVTFHAAVPGWVTLFMAVFTPLYFGLGRWAAGCFVFCTRAAFDAAGGFDERYYCAEEWVFSNALKRHGRFVVLREPVVTSERKTDTASARRIALLVHGVMMRGLAGLRDRRYCGFWYDRG